MKSLKESLLDNEDEIVDKLDVKPFIEEWLKKYSIKNYKINKNNTIDIKGDVLLHRYPESKLPSYIQFGKVTGNFYINNSKLETLKGCPSIVTGDFACNSCPNLESLEGAPKKVGKNFSCGFCPSLISLKGSPEKVGRFFYCNSCQNLKTLKGAPKEVGRDFDCSNCKLLKTLKGAPEKVGGDFDCSWCKNLNTTETDIEKICKVRGEIYVYK